MDERLHGEAWMDGGIGLCRDIVAGRRDECGWLDRLWMIGEADM